MRALLSEQQNHRCCYCGEHFTHYNPATIEHVIPKARGGTDDYDNLVVACEPCNRQRGDELSAILNQQRSAAPRVKKNKGSKYIIIVTPKQYEQPYPKLSGVRYVPRNKS